MAAGWFCFVMGWIRDDEPLEFILPIVTMAVGLLLAGIGLIA